MRATIIGLCLSLLVMATGCEEMTGRHKITVYNNNGGVVATYISDCGVNNLEGGGYSFFVNGHLISVTGTVVVEPVESK